MHGYALRLYIRVPKAVLNAQFAFPAPHSASSLCRIFHGAMSISPETHRHILQYTTLLRNRQDTQPRWEMTSH